MVVVPPHLIEQWTDELGSVSGSLKFSVYLEITADKGAVVSVSRDV